MSVAQLRSVSRENSEKDSMDRNSTDRNSMDRNSERGQAERHKADYDLNTVFRKPEALALVAEAEAAFEAWDRVRSDPVSEVFLLVLLFGDRWDR